MEVRSRERTGLVITFGMWLHHLEGYSRESPTAGSLPVHTCTLQKHKLVYQKRFVCSRSGVYLCKKNLFCIISVFPLQQHQHSQAAPISPITRSLHRTCTPRNTESVFTETRSSSWWKKEERSKLCHLNSRDHSCTATLHLHSSQGCLICSLFNFCSHVCSLFTEQSLIYLQIYTYITTPKRWRALLVYLLLTRWTRTISTMNSVYQDEDTSAELNLCRQQRLAERRRDVVSHPQHLSEASFC